MTVATISCFAGLVLLLWPTFTSAIHELPLFAGYRRRVCSPPAMQACSALRIVGLMAGVFTLLIGQFPFARIRSPLVRVATAPDLCSARRCRGRHRVMVCSGSPAPANPATRGFSRVGGMLNAGVPWVRVTALEPEIEAARQRWRELGARAYHRVPASSRSRPPSLGSMPETVGSPTLKWDAATPARPRVQFASVQRSWSNGAQRGHCRCPSLPPVIAV